MARFPNVSLLYLLLFFILLAPGASAQLEVSFPSGDGLTITADWYPVNSDYPVILLCHQNGFSRGEFRETALRLNKFGFNCMAVDLRVGGEIHGVVNKTAERAKEAGQSPQYMDASQEMIAAVNYLFKKYHQKVIILGSSYSASLALLVASGTAPVKAIALFSPGEYSGKEHFIRDSVKNITIPVFATSSLKESGSVTELLRDVNSRIKVQFIPKSEGDHGAKVLWSTSPGNQEYWIALMSYLDKIKAID